MNIQKNEAPDGLAILIQDSLDHDPGFGEAWPLLALLSKLIDERLRLGLSQAEVAAKMGVAKSTIAKLENDPSRVAFARIMAYARVLGAEIEVKPGKATKRVRHAGTMKPA